MCHIFFIHSSLDGHLGCFRVLAIVNNAAMSSPISLDYLLWGILLAPSLGQTLTCRGLDFHCDSVLSYSHLPHSCCQSSCPATQPHPAAPSITTFSLCLSVCGQGPLSN